MNLPKPKRHIMLKEGEQYDLVFDSKSHGRLALSAGVNPLNNKWMWWWSIGHAMYAGAKSDIKDIVEGVRKKATAVYIDTFWR